MLGGGVKAPAATVCTDVILVFVNASCASCSQDCPAARAPDTNAPLTAGNATIANLFTQSPLRLTPNFRFSLPRARHCIPVQVALLLLRGGNPIIHDDENEAKLKRTRKDEAIGLVSVGGITLLLCALLFSVLTTANRASNLPIDEIPW